jgi:hypothetical protein
MKPSLITFDIHRWFEAPSMSVDFEVWLNTFPTKVVFENSLDSFKRAWLSGSPNPTLIFNLALSLRNLK